MNQPSPRQGGARHAKPEPPEHDLDAPTVNLGVAPAAPDTFSRKLTQKQKRWLNVARWIGIAGLLLLIVMAVVRSATQPAPSTAPASPSSYQQGYSYGRSLDGGGYGGDESYSACRSGSQSQPSAQDIEAFQLGCDIGYAQ